MVRLLLPHGTEFLHVTKGAPEYVGDHNLAWKAVRA